MSGKNKKNSFIEVTSVPTKSGKGVSSVIPTLLSYPGSIIVLDFKGENFHNCPSLKKQYKIKTQGHMTILEPKTEHAQTQPKPIKKTVK